MDKIRYEMDHHKKIQYDCELLTIQCQELEKEMKRLPTNLRLADQYMVVEQELEEIRESHESLRNMETAYNRERVALDKRIQRTQLNMSILKKRVDKCKGDVD